MSLPEFSSAPTDAVASVSMTISQQRVAEHQLLGVDLVDQLLGVAVLGEQVDLAGQHHQRDVFLGLDAEVLAIGLEALFDSVAAFAGLIDDAALDNAPVEEIDTPGHAHRGVDGEEALARPGGAADHRAAALGRDSRR